MKLRLNDIKLLVYDCDGVLTNNSVYIDSNGNEFINFNRSDGMAIRLLKEYGKPQIILTSEVSANINLRSEKLGIQLFAGIKNKYNFMIEYSRINNIELSKILFIGNDLNDYGVMESVGFPICPKDAFQEIKKLSKLVLKLNGGTGVIRDLLSHFYEYDEIIRPYKL